MTAICEKGETIVPPSAAVAALASHDDEDENHEEEKIDEKVLLELNKNLADVTLSQEELYTLSETFSDVSIPIPYIDDWVVPERVKKDYVVYRAGYDRQNRPLWIVDVSTFDIKKLVATEEEKATFIRYIRRTMRATIRSISERSTPENPVDGAVVLVDIRSFKMWQLLYYPAISFLMRLCSDHTHLLTYVTRGYMVNTNAVALAGVKMIRPLLGKFFERAVIYGANRDKWVPKLLKDIDPSQLPETFGGDKNFKPNYDWH